MLWVGDDEAIKNDTVEIILDEVIKRGMVGGGGGQSIRKQSNDHVPFIHGYVGAFNSWLARSELSF